MSPSDFFLPEGLPVLSATGLIAVSFVTSFITAAMGIGGGVALLSIMALLMPAVAIIPVHGLVQMGSNAGRLVLMRKYVLWWTVLPFALGSALGVALGGAVAANMPPPAIEIGVGLFILVTLYIPIPDMGRLAMPVGGFISSTLTMFFGATGPFVSSLVKGLKPDRLGQVATHAALMSLQHSLKILVFGLFGFAFAAWLPLAIVMITTGFAGTFAGRSVLMKLDERMFQFVFTLLLTLLALLLVWSGAHEWIGSDFGIAG